MAEPTQNSILSWRKFTWCITWERVLFVDGYYMAEQMAWTPDFTWEKSPFYKRILYGGANGSNAGFYMRKSPFTDGYYMAEQMARRPKLLHKKESFWGRILHGKTNGLEAALLCKKESFNGWVSQANGLKADFYRKMSPFTDGYYMAEHVARRPTVNEYENECRLWQFTSIMKTPTGGMSGRNEARQIIQTFYYRKNTHGRK